MPLRHVCMWSEHGWKPITAVEASKIHPGGTVQARSGLFKCDICGQYVGLSDGPVRDRYFYHSSSEQDKYCADRSFSGASIAVFDAKNYNLPIRLEIISTSTFELQMGFMSFPSDTTGKQLSIEPVYSAGRPFLHNLSKLQESGLTYLPIGSHPASKYRITLINGESIWPEWVDGIPDTGALFDAETGKKLPPDADVQVCHPYYLLKRWRVDRNSDIEVECLCEKRDGPSAWYIYKVMAEKLTRYADQFFNQYHCRLTEKPIALFPIWPVCVDTPYILRHAGDSVMLYLQGYKVEAKAFPETDLRTFFCSHSDDSHVLHLKCRGRQQLLSSGRTRVLKYTYLWKDQLAEYSSAPEIVVTILDQWGIRVEVPFDGQVLLQKSGHTVNKYFLKANTPIEIPIQYTCEVKIYQGLDLVWCDRYETKRFSANDMDLVRKLEQCSGPRREISHSIGAALAHIQGSLELKAWLRKKVRQGEMAESAYQLLIRHIMEKRNEKV